MKILGIWWLSVAVTIMISPVRLWIDYRHRGKTEDTLLFKISFLWGLKHFTLQVPIIASTSKGVKIRAQDGKKQKRWGIPRPSPAQLAAGLEEWKKLKGGVSKLLGFFGRKVMIKYFVWHTELGMADSARLAQITGGIWAGKGVVCAGLKQLLNFKRRPILRVIPHFQRSYFRTVFTCILEFRLGYAIIAAFFAAYLILKHKLYRRGEENVRTSNPGSDEDGHGKYQRDGGCEYGNR